MNNLHSAARKGDIAGLKHHLDRWQEQDRDHLTAGRDTLVFSRSKFALCREERHGCSLLHTAVTARQEEMALHLASAFPALLVARDAGGRSALHLAAREGLATLYTGLVELGADQDLEDEEGFTPQQWWGREEVETPTTPRYAQLDWSHHRGRGERRGATSVEHARLVDNKEEGSAGSPNMKSIHMKTNIESSKMGQKKKNIGKQGKAGGQEQRNVREKEKNSGQQRNGISGIRDKKYFEKNSNSKEEETTWFQELNKEEGPQKTSDELSRDTTVAPESGCGGPPVPHTWRPNSRVFLTSTTAGEESRRWREALGAPVVTALEQALSRALSVVVRERPGDPVARLAELLQQQQGGGQTGE